MRKLPPALLAALSVSARALAEQSAPPPLFSAERIRWAVRCAGEMPPVLSVSLAVIGVLIVACVVRYRKAGDRDEP